MSKVFRAKFVAELRKNKADIPQNTYDILFKKQWVVYAKQAFCTPNSVIEYLGRYSHKVAISNHRILKIDNKNNTVTFSLKNYKKDGEKETLTLKQDEFIRRFSLHILPKGFTRIRHYGILSSTWKSKNLKALQEKLNTEKIIQILPKEIKLGKCPICKKMFGSRIQTIKHCLDRRSAHSCGAKSDQLVLTKLPPISEDREKALAALDAAESTTLRRSGVSAYRRIRKP